MANHVYFNVTVDGNDRAMDEYYRLMQTEEVTRSDYEGNKYQMEELKAIDELRFMPAASYDSDGNQLDAYDWYCDNVGAKWCHMEDFDNTSFSGYSAWRAPHELVGHLIVYLAKYDPYVSAKMTYEDEFRNFVGIQTGTAKEKPQDWWKHPELAEYYYENEVIEVSTEEIQERLEAELGVDTSKEDLEWWDPIHTLKGELSLMEYQDELVYEFFDKEEWYYDRV
jgi:hypothetical protein